MSQFKAHGGEESASSQVRNRGNPPLESRFPHKPMRRFEELAAICRKAEGDEGARGAFLDAVRSWRSDSAFRAAEPNAWKEGDNLIRETMRRMAQPSLEDIINPKPPAIGNMRGI